MLRLQCTDPVIHLNLPPCSGHMASATLSQPAGASLTLQAQINPPDAPDGTVVLALPTNPTPCKGVWRLTLNTDCGCFETKVWVDCPPPALLAMHEPTNDGPFIQACCELERQDDWGESPVLTPINEPPQDYTYTLAQDLPEPEGAPDGTVAQIEPTPPSHYSRWLAYSPDGVIRGEGEVVDGFLIGYVSCIITEDYWMELS